jgi:hypothetical protein
VNYFIHGKELTLEFDFPKAWLVVLSYNQIPVSDKIKKQPLRGIQNMLIV